MVRSELIILQSALPKIQKKVYITIVNSQWRYVASQTKQFLFKKGLPFGLF